VQAAELEWPEVHVPNPVVDLLEPDVLADTNGRDVDPAPVPANPAIGAHVAHLESVWIDQRRQFAAHLPVRGAVRARRRVLIERLVRSLVIELPTKDIELPLLCGEARRGWTRRLVLKRSVHALVAPVLLRLARLDELGQYA